MHIALMLTLSGGLLAVGLNNDWHTVLILGGLFAGHALTELLNH